MFPARPAMTKRISQGKTLARYPGRIRSGPKGLISHSGILPNIPGPDSGMQLPGLRAPALPFEQHSPGPWESMRTTS